MAGPFGMMRAHDMRDWHQRQSWCPPHPSHDAGFWLIKVIEAVGLAWDVKEPGSEAPRDGLTRAQKA